MAYKLTAKKYMVTPWKTPNAKQEKKQKMPQFTIGQAVEKVSGYKFIGYVIGVVTTRAGKIRYVVENDDGIIHIFRGSQLKSVE